MRYLPILLLLGCGVPMPQSNIPGLSQDQYDILIDGLIQDEGFIGHQYDDNFGNPTIGYGTLLPISREEGRLLVSYRVERNANTFIDHWHVYFNEPVEIKIRLLNASYQLGAEGLLNFKKALGYLEVKDCEGAIDEFLNSKWDHETPNRVDELINSIKEYGCK